MAFHTFLGIYLQNEYAEYKEFMLEKMSGRNGLSKEIESSAGSIGSIMASTVSVDPDEIVGQ